MESVSIYTFDPRTISPTSLSLIFGHSTQATTNLVHWLVAMMPCEFSCGFGLSSLKSFEKLFPPSCLSSSFAQWSAFQDHLDSYPSPSLAIVDHHWSPMCFHGLASGFLDKTLAAKRQMARIIVDSHPWGSEGFTCRLASTIPANRLIHADYIFLFANKTQSHRETLWKVVQDGFDTYRNFLRYWDTLATSKRAMVISLKAIREGCKDVSKFVFYCEAPSTPPPIFGNGVWRKTGLFPLPPLERFEPGSIESFGSKQILVRMASKENTKALVSSLVDYLVSKRHIEWVNAITTHNLGFDPSCTFDSVDKWNVNLIRTMVKTMETKGDSLMAKACLIFDSTILLPEWPSIRSLLRSGGPHDPLLIVLDSPLDIPLNPSDLAIFEPQAIVFTKPFIDMSGPVFELRLQEGESKKDTLVAWNNCLYQGTSSFTPSPEGFFSDSLTKVLKKNPFAEIYMSPPPISKKEKSLINGDPKDENRPKDEEKTNPGGGKASACRSKPKVTKNKSENPEALSSENETNENETVFPDAPRRLTRQVACLHKTDFPFEPPVENSTTKSKPVETTTESSRRRTTTLFYGMKAQEGPSGTTLRTYKPVSTPGCLGTTVKPPPVIRAKHSFLTSSPTKSLSARSSSANVKPLTAKAITPFKEARDKPKEAGDKPKEASDKPKEAGDKPKEASDKPKEASDKPKDFKSKDLNKKEETRAPCLHGKAHTTPTEEVPPSSWWSGLW